MICAADTIGVFQIESRAQMSMLPRLRPRCFYDLVIEVAIVRPGPIQGGMVHPYLRRRAGLEPVRYPSAQVRRVLEKTLGVPLFQEQVMRLAVVAAGFTPGAADRLRRAMAAWRRSGQIEKFQLQLVAGMLARGYTREFAAQIYRQIRGFGEYGFPESHAASFALLVYASAWLKRYHPAAFCAALLNSQPLGFYTPGQLVRDAIAHGVPVRPVDVNFSQYDCTLEDPAPARGKNGPALRLGMRLVRGLSAEKVRGIEAARRAGAIRSIRQLARRGDVSRETLLRLAAADAFRSLGLDRRQALWQILALNGAEGPLFAELEPDEPPVELPAISPQETVVQDYEALGFSLNAHPLELVRQELAALELGVGRGLVRDAGAPDSEVRRYEVRRYGVRRYGVRRHGVRRYGNRAAGRFSSGMPDDGPGGARRAAARGTPVVTAERLKQMRNGVRAAVAGLVTCRQRPGTARGMVFMTLEDETGMANLVISPKVWERQRRIACGSVGLIAEGHVERQGQVVHLVVRRFHELSARLGEPAHRARDFH